MNDRDLAAKLLQDHFTATAALIALMLKNLPDDVRTRTFDAVRNGTGKVELRTRVESNETELVLAPTVGLIRCHCRGRDRHRRHARMTRNRQTSMAARSR
jgi:hypothetical protein